MGGLPADQSRLRRQEIDPILLKPSAVARALGAVALVLLLVSTAGQLVKFLTGHDELMGLLSLTFVGNERNIPTLFSVLLLASASLVCAVTAALARKGKDPDVWRWVVLSAGFLYLGFDEGLSLHERMSVPIKAYLGDGALGFSHSFWAIPGLAGVAVLGLFFQRFLGRLPARTRRAFLMAGAIYVGGAVGFELIGGNYAEVHGDENLGYSALVTVEEGMEMGGVIVFIWAVLAHLAEKYGEVRFRLRTGPPAA